MEQEKGGKDKIRMNTIKNLFLPLSLCFIASFAMECPVDTTVDLAAAYSEIGSAIDYKAKVCGHSPGYPLLLPNTPSAYGVKLCALTIIRSECPFNDYPLFCLEIYSEVCDLCDLPLIGP